jgi:hypothetical protein
MNEFIDLPKDYPCPKEGNNQRNTGTVYIILT